MVTRNCHDWKYHRFIWKHLRFSISITLLIPHAKLLQCYYSMCPSTHVFSLCFRTESWLMNVDYATLRTLRNNNIFNSAMRKTWNKTQRCLCKHEWNETWILREAAWWLAGFFKLNLHKCTWTLCHSFPLNPSFLYFCLIPSFPFAYLIYKTNINFCNIASFYEIFRYIEEA